MHKYEVLKKAGEGTFSDVLVCQGVMDGKCYALKKMKQTFQSINEVNSLPEVRALRRLNPHPNVITLHEVVFDPISGTLALACELMSLNLYELIRDRREFLPEDHIRHYMHQLCMSLEHTHRNGIFHRDIKPENILINVATHALKLADFGSCRSVHSRQPLTEYISTRWYRAPECLLTDGYYTEKMDMWSAGCVFYEMRRLQPLFPGSNELDQINKIHEILGTPKPQVLAKFKQSKSMSFNFRPQRGRGLASVMPNASKQATDLLRRLCEYDPDVRISSKICLRHSYFGGADHYDEPIRSIPHTSVPTIRHEVLPPSFAAPSLPQIHHSTLQQQTLPVRAGPLPRRHHHRKHAERGRKVESFLPAAGNSGFELSYRGLPAVPKAPHMTRLEPSIPTLPALVQQAKHVKARHDKPGVNVLSLPSIRQHPRARRGL